MSSTIVSLTAENNRPYGEVSRANEPSFSVSAASLFPEFHHADGNQRFDATRLFHSGPSAHQIVSFKTAGDAAAAAHHVSASNSVNQGNGNDNFQRFLEPLHVFQSNTHTPPFSAGAPCLAPSSYPVTQVPTPVPPSSVGSSEPPADFVMDEFDQMLSQIPLLDDFELDIPATAAVQQSPSKPLSSPAVVPVMVASAHQVEVDSKIAALHAITKQTATKPNATEGMKVAGVKRSRKYQAGQWDHRYNELLQFQAQHGHMLVPHSYPPNQKLAQWVKRYVI